MADAFDEIDAIDILTGPPQAQGDAFGPNFQTTTSR